MLEDKEKGDFTLRHLLNRDFSLNPEVDDSAWGQEESEIEVPPIVNILNDDCRKRPREVYFLMRSIDRNALTAKKREDAA